MPEMWMDVDAALTEVPVNIVALIDDTDFISREESVVYNQAGMDLVWNFVDTAGVFTQTAVTPTTAGDYDWTNQLNGMYSIEIPASAGASINNDSEGHGWFSGFATGILPWRGPVIGFRAAALNNALIDGGDNLDVNIAQWLTQAVTLSGGNLPDVNAAEVSDDSVAADNLEATYDGTGYTDDDAPAKQSQLAAIANVGAAVNTPAESYTLTTGTQSSGLYSDTAALDGTNHEHTDAAGLMDLYYQFAIGGDGSPTSITMTGYLNGANDDLEVYAYNWGGTSWDRIGELSGKAATTNEVNVYNLFTSHVGTGANLGKVRIRFTDGAFTLTTATLAVDQIFVSYAIVRRSVGYADGAIWLDTNASNTSTENYVDGTADNPVSTWAAILTLSGNLNINRFRIKNGSSLTLTGNSDNYTLIGESWTLALGGQSIAAAYIQGATISGIATGSGYVLRECEVGAATMAPGEQHFCHYTDVATGLTFGSTGTYFINDPRSGVPGNTAPKFTWDGSGTTKANFRGASCGIQFEAMVAGDVATIEGFGQFVEGTCTGGAVTIRGMFTLSGITNITLTDDARIDIGQINAEVITALSDYDVPTDAEMIARTLVAANYGTAANQTNIEADTQDIQGRLPAALVSSRMDSDVRAINGNTASATKLALSADSIETGAAVTGTLSTTQMTTDLTEVTDDHYIGRVLIWTSGNLIRQVASVTDYLGSTKMLTFTIVTEAPVNGDTWIMV